MKYVICLWFAAMVEFLTANWVSGFPPIKQRGRTALMFAAENDHVDCVIALTTAGADTKITDKVCSK